MKSITDDAQTAEDVRTVLNIDRKRCRKKTHVKLGVSNRPASHIGHCSQRYERTAPA